MKNTITTLLALSTLVWYGCGPDPKQESYEDGSKTSTFTSAGGQSSGDTLVTVPVSVDYGAFALAGTAATNYSVSLDSCLSLYTATVDETNGDVEVYKDDRSCLAKLTSLTVGATTYTSVAAGATDFTTWLANDTAIFSDGSGNVIRVKVISQLASPITGTEVVEYSFSEILDGTADQTVAEAAISDAHVITVASAEAPSFTITATNFVSMDDTSGAPEFTFDLVCVDDPTAGSPATFTMTNGSGTNDRCDPNATGGNDLSVLEYKLVKDTYSSAVTITDAEAIFGTAGDTVTEPTDQIADGFSTVLLDGPGPLGTAGNENMILIIKSTGGADSYTYFNVDVTTIVQ